MAMAAVGSKISGLNHECPGRHFLGQLIYDDDTTVIFFLFDSSAILSGTRLC